MPKQPPVGTCGRWSEIIGRGGGGGNKAFWMPRPAASNAAKDVQREFGSRRSQTDVFRCVTAFGKEGYPRFGLDIPHQSSFLTCLRHEYCFCFTCAGARVSTQYPMCKSTLALGAPKYKFVLGFRATRAFGYHTFYLHFLARGF